MIQVDILKAKEIAHEKRRAARATELAPLDIQVTILMYAEQAEIKRQEIRSKYEDIQVQIDEATTEQELKEAIKDLL